MVHLQTHKTKQYGNNQKQIKELYDTIKFHIKSKIKITIVFFLINIENSVKTNSQTTTFKICKPYNSTGESSTQVMWRRR